MPAPLEAEGWAKNQKYKRWAGPSSFLGGKSKISFFLLLELGSDRATTVSKTWRDCWLPEKLRHCWGLPLAVYLGEMNDDSGTQVPP